MSEDTVMGVRVKLRRLLELGLYSSVFTTLTAVLWWFWLEQIDPALLHDAAMYDNRARLMQFLSSRDVFLALALAELLMGLAALLALTPLGWWLESDLLAEPVLSPIQVLARTIRKARAVQVAAADSGDDPAATPTETPPSPIPGSSAAPGVIGTPSNPSAQHKPVEQSGQPTAASQSPAAVGQPATPSQPAAPGQPLAVSQPQAVGQPVAADQPQAGQPQVAQPQAASQPGAPGQPQPGQPQPGQPQPGQPQPGQPAAGQPQAAQAPGQTAQPQSALQALQAGPESESPLDDLGDMDDLLAVFDDDAGVAQWLLDLSSELPDLPVEPLAATAIQVMRDLKARRADRTRMPTAALSPLAA
jgi:hypothetical protein